jgi:putative endonuclease
MGVYIYMLRCAGGSYYVGSATGDDLGPRIDQHNIGSHITNGVAAERQLKGWSRAKKEALLSSDWARVSQLPRRRAGKAKRS